MGYFCHRNTLKLHMMQKLFSTISNVRAITQKLCSPDDGSSKRQAPIDQSPRHRHTFPPRGFLHWRLSDGGPGASLIVPIGRHPKPFTKPDLPQMWLLTQLRHGGLAWHPGVTSMF